MSEFLPPVAALRPVAQALEELGVAYHIGGSIASSFHGRARSTMDVDIVAELQVRHIDPLVAHLEKDYYIDAEMIADAIRSRSSFNIIYLPLSFKVDIFIPGGRRFDAAARQRIVQGDIPGDAERQYPMASAEDVILNKLEWFRIGGETSERQWGDVVEIIRTKTEKLDRKYLMKWAADLMVSDLLDCAMQDAVIED